jgi:lipoprotein-releasing system permease protein
MIGHYNIALRYIRNKGNKFTSFLSIITILGISLGVASLIVTTSVMNGFSKQIIDRILNTTAHIEVYSQSDNLNLDLGGDSRTTIIKKNSAVIKGNGVKGVQVISLNKDNGLNLNIVSGDKNSIYGKKRKLGVGVGVADRLKIEVGDKVSLIYEDKNKKAKTKIYRIGYIFESGVGAYDENIATISMGGGEKLWPNSIYINEIRVSNPMDLEKHVTKIKSHLKMVGLACPDCIITWKDKNKNLMGAMDTERVVMALILSIIVLISLFNLLSSLIMTVKDKTSSICMMKTIGANNNDIKKIFMIQGGLMGVVGATAGAIFGLILSNYIEIIVGFFERLFGSKILDPSIYYVSTITSEINYTEVAVFYFGAIILSIISTIYPARIASKTEIVSGLENA